MHATELWAQAARLGGLEGAPADYPEPPAEGVCCLTGEIGPTIARKHLITSSYTRVDLLRAPHSDRIGVAVWDAWTWGWRKEGKSRDYCPERMSAWFAWQEGLDGELLMLSRADIRECVLYGAPEYEASALFATTSYKKHGTLIAPVNRGKQFRVGWDDEVVDLSDRAKVDEWWTVLRAAQDAGFPRPVLESLDCSPFLLRTLWREWQPFEAWARPKRMAPLYRFLCYLLPSQEELKAGAK